MTSFESYYNTRKSQILLREYGRTVQEMCDTMLKMEDRENRTRTAHTIIEVMRLVNPTIPNNAPKDLDTENKLWDDLHIICNFELEIDAPFPAPEPDIIGKKPKPLAYRRNSIRLRHYGKNLELLVGEAKLKTDPEEQYQAYAFILRLMKTYYSNWNVDNNQDGNFLGDIERLAGKEFSDEMRERLLIEGGIIDPSMMIHFKQRQNNKQDKSKQNFKNKNRNGLNKTNNNNNNNGNNKNRFKRFKGKK